MVSRTIIGQPAGHVEGPAKVTGQARYAADIALPGMLWGKCLRSPFPHARIISIDVSRAEALPGVRAVITGRDLKPDLRIGRRMFDMPVLARDRVRFVGEKVAAVAADSLEAAEEAISLIEVEYDDLPAVFDPLEAMQETAPRIHEDPASYHGAHLPIPPIPNVLSQVIESHGDVEGGMAQADRIFEHTFTTPCVHQGYIEPHACVVRIDSDGRADIWLCNKMPYQGRSHMAGAIAVPEDRIRFNAVPIGGDFGGKGSLMDSVVCYYLAKRSGRPVKMVMSYVEELMAGNPRHASVITIRTGITRDGRISAREAKAIFNSGAYGAFKPTPTVNLHGAADAGGPYRVPNIYIESLCVYTNTVPCGHVRSPGAPQMVFAVESQMDIIAQELGLDPLELRLRNALKDGDVGPLGQRWRNIRCTETLLAAAEASGWGNDKGRNIGRGIATYERGPGFGISNAELRLEEDGRFTLSVGVPDTGTGSYTILQQIVAEELGVPLGRVQVAASDTDHIPFDSGAGGSRVTHATGQASLSAARAMMEKLIGMAAGMLGHDPRELDFKDGRFQALDGKDASLAEVIEEAVKKMEMPIISQGSYSSTDWPDVTSFCAQVAEVEVDPGTGQVTLRKLTTAHDVGRIINPLTHQGQIDGGVIQGIGQGLVEHLMIEDGNVLTLNLGDYKMPNIADIPVLVTVLAESNDGPAPHSGKAIGELGNVPTPAAIANAVADAVGVRVFGLPLTSEKVYSELQGR